MNYKDLSQKTIEVYKEGGWYEAIKYINNYINENPNTYEAYLVRSELYTENSNFQKALEDAEKAIKINPQEASVYNNRGSIYVQSGNDINKALNDFNKAIELNANYISAYTNRANVYMQMEEFRKAINDCTKAIDISPNENIEPYYNRGLAYMNIGETAKALDDYNKVIELDSKNAEAYARRGAINSQLGNTQEAIHDYEEFLRLDPDNKNAKLVRDELGKLKNCTISSSAESYEVVTAKKEITTILIGAIVGAIIIGGWYSTIVSGSEVLAGIWIGFGMGGGISLVPVFFRVGRTFSIVGGIICVFLLLIFVCGFTGFIWPIIRILIKIHKIKKIQRNG